MNKLKQLNNKEIAEIQNNNPFWIIDCPPLVIKSYKNGKKEMFVIIRNVKYFIKQYKDGKTEWYKVEEDGSKKR